MFAANSGVNANAEPAAVSVNDASFVSVAAAVWLVTVWALNAAASLPAVSCSGAAPGV